ncbi:hypothetical protein EB796_006263 [Bugula neritina]|uniref:Uncharacterized protein n=1 Tax=Bugula neritina TaxID=10212 RepID=A0A7J7K9U7_BUGNE|nr:hypothetical protein EB796_006263 [Bugula neritina]
MTTINILCLINCAAHLLNLWLTYNKMFQITYIAINHFIEKPLKFITLFIKKLYTEIVQISKSSCEGASLCGKY